jgi:cell division protein FtsB
MMTISWPRAGERKLALEAKALKKEVQALKKTVVQLQAEVATLKNKVAKMTPARMARGGKRPPAAK